MLVFRRIKAEEPTGDPDMGRHVLLGNDVPEAVRFHQRLPTGLVLELGSVYSRTYACEQGQQQWHKRAQTMSGRRHGGVGGGRERYALSVKSGEGGVRLAWLVVGGSLSRELLQKRVIERLYLSHRGEAITLTTCMHQHKCWHAMFRSLAFKTSTPSSLFLSVPLRTSTYL